MARIEIYSGRIGASKSYHAVLAIINHLIKGGVVVTNIPLDITYILAYVLRKYSLELDPAAIIVLEHDATPHFYKVCPPGNPLGLSTLVVIDEAHIWFNARDYSKNPRETMYFLSQTRKVGIDVIFVTQHPNNLDKQFMRLVTGYWVFRDMQKLILPFIGKYPLPHFKVSQFDYDGKTRVESRYARKDVEIYKCYNSYALHSGFENAPIPQYAKPKKVRKKLHVMWKVAIAAMVIVVIFMCVKGGPLKWIFRDVYKAQDAAKEKFAKPQVVAVPPAPAVAGVVPQLPLIAKEEPARPRHRSVTLVRFGNYGDSVRTEVGWFIEGGQTPYGNCRVLDPDAGYAECQDAVGNRTYVTMIFPSKRTDPVTLPEVRDLGEVPKPPMPALRVTSSVISQPAEQ